MSLVDDRMRNDFSYGKVFKTRCIRSRGNMSIRLASPLILVNKLPDLAPTRSALAAQRAQPLQSVCCRDETLIVTALAMV